MRRCMWAEIERKRTLKGAARKNDYKAIKNESDKEI